MTDYLDIAAGRLARYDAAMKDHLPKILVEPSGHEIACEHERYVEELEHEVEALKVAAALPCIVVRPEFETLTAEQRDRLIAELEAYKTRHREYVMIPSSPTLEMATIAELREALDNAVQRMIDEALAHADETDG